MAATTSAGCTPDRSSSCERGREHAAEGQRLRTGLLRDALAGYAALSRQVLNIADVYDGVPRLNKFAYRVTTQWDFEETLVQLYGGAEGASIDELLADMGAGPLEDDGDNMALESAAADNELVKFVNKVIIDACIQKASDIHVEPLPGKAKTGIRFRVDGALQPYIEVPAQFRQALVTRLKIMCDLDISEKRKPQDGRLKLWKAAGCEKCNQTGYKGRLGLHELLVVDDDVKRLVQERARVADLFAAALEAGMRTLKMDGMEKVMLGMTDLKQVRSVCIK